MSRGAKKDIAVTKLLLANHLLLDKRSFVSLGAEPHLYLKGDDVVCQRQRVWHASKGRCAKCKRPIYVFNFEMDHKQGGTVGRHDDLSNLQALCQPCHREKHVHPQFGKERTEAIQEFNKIYSEGEK